MNVHIHQFPSCIVIMAFNASNAGHTRLKERILSINSGQLIWIFASNIFAIFETFSTLKIFQNANFWMKIVALTQCVT